MTRTIELLDRAGHFSARRDPWGGAADRVVVIRRADAGDRWALTDLATLDAAAPLGADVLVAVVDGELWAALDLADGRVVADPFRPAAEVVDVLRLRGARLRAAAAPSAPVRRGLRLRPRRASA